MSRLLLSACAALGLAASACTAPMTRPQLEAELASAGASLGGPAQVFAIHAGSRVEAFTQLSEERNTPESAALSGQLSRRLAAGARRGATVVAGGPHAELSDRVVVNALGRQSGTPLAGLTLVFVSPEPPGPELRAAAQRAHVRLHHHAIAVK